MGKPTKPKLAKGSQLLMGKPINLILSCKRGPLPPKAAAVISLSANSNTEAMARVSRSQKENGGPKGLVLQNSGSKDPLNFSSKTDSALQAGKQQQKHRAKGRRVGRLLPHGALLLIFFSFSCWSSSFLA